MTASDWRLLSLAAVALALLLLSGYLWIRLQRVNAKSDVRPQAQGLPAEQHGRDLSHLAANERPALPGHREIAARIDGLEQLVSRMGDESRTRNAALVASFNNLAARSEATAVEVVSTLREIVSDVHTTNAATLDTVARVVEQVAHVAHTTEQSTARTVAALQETTSRVVESIHAQASLHDRSIAQLAATLASAERSDRTFYGRAERSELALDAAGRAALQAALELDASDAVKSALGTYGVSVALAEERDRDLGGSYIALDVQIDGVTESKLAEYRPRILEELLTRIPDKMKKTLVITVRAHEKLD